MNESLRHIPVVILCGGRGVVLGEGQGERMNKALVRVHGKPLVWWVVLHYAAYGARDFLLPAGLQAERIAQALVEMCGAVPDAASPWSLHCEIRGIRRHLRLVQTGVEDSTAARLLACRHALEAVPTFALAYSDTLADVDLGAELEFHQSHGMVATLVSTQCPVRFRILGMRQGESLVRAFAPRPVIEAAAINGGYYFFGRGIWDARYGVAREAPLETLPLERLAAAGQLQAFEHRGRWQYCDAERDLALLQPVAEQIAAQSAP